MINQVTLEGILSVWKDRFADFNGFTFAFVGSIDPGTLRPLVETYLGGLPSKSRRERLKAAVIRYPSVGIERRVTGGSEPRSWVWICFTAPERWTMDAERDARILDAILQIRMFEILRRDSSGVYTEDVNVDLQRDPTERHFLTLLFACAPENVNRLRDTVLTELAGMARNGVGREYLAKVSAQMRKQHEVDLRDNEWWLTHLQDAYRHGDDFAAATDLEATLARVTSDHVRATADRIVRGKPHIAITLQPEASSKDR